MAASDSTDTPSYWEVWSLLYDGKGDCRPLLRRFPLFDPESPLPENPCINYLHYACNMSHLPVVRGLVACGASLQQASIYGLLPLHLALGTYEERCAPVVRWILAQPDGLATINAVSKSGWTALHIAAFRGSAALVKELLAHGAHTDLATGAKRRGSSNSGSKKKGSNNSSKKKGRDSSSKKKIAANPMGYLNFG